MGEFLERKKIHIKLKSSQRKSSLKLLCTQSAPPPPFMPLRANRYFPKKEIHHATSLIIIFYFLKSSAYPLPFLPDPDATFRKFETGSLFYKRSKQDKKIFSPENETNRYIFTDLQCDSALRSTKIKGHNDQHNWFVQKSRATYCVGVPTSGYIYSGVGRWSHSAPPPHCRNFRPGAYAAVFPRACTAPPLPPRLASGSPHGGAAAHCSPQCPPR